MEQEPFRIYLRDVAYSAYSEAAAGAGELLAWYREYRQPAEIEKGYTELDWVLTEKALLRVQVSPSSVEISTFMLNKLIRVTRHYIIVQKKENYEHVLNRVVAKFNNGEACELMRPLEDIINKEQTGGFSHLVSLLG
ncbi:MAG: hypothetical protein ABRQ24_10675 [Syntrophomonadaceae bacterium]